MNNTKFYKILYRIDLYDPRHMAYVIRLGFKIVSLKNIEELSKHLAIKLINEKQPDISIRKIISIDKKDIKNNLHVAKDYIENRETKQMSIHSWMATKNSKSLIKTKKGLIYRDWSI